MARGTPRRVVDLFGEALDARDLDAPGRKAAVADIGKRLDLLFAQAHPHDANRRLIKHLRHERHALFTFLTTDGVDATNWRGEQGCARRWSTPNPGVVAGLTLRPWLTSWVSKYGHGTAPSQKSVGESSHRCRRHVVLLYLGMCTFCSDAHREGSSPSAFQHHLSIVPALLIRLRSHTPVSLTAALFLRCNRGVNEVFNLVAGVSDGLWLGLMNDAVLHKVDEIKYRGEARYYRPDYNVRGLLSWERDAVERYFGDAKRLVVTAAGGGREMYTLLSEGYDVTGFECNEKMVRAGNDLLREAGFGERLLPAQRDGWPELPETYDGVIIGWGSYIHIRGRAKRVDFLRQARSHVTKGAPLLVSFYARKGDTVYFRIVAALANRLRRLRGDEPVEIGDSLVPNFAHFFTEKEIREELAEGGFEMVSFDTEEYARSVALAR